MTLPDSPSFIVRAADDTPIACARRGRGPVLLLIHGSGGSGAQFAAVGAALAGAFAVVAMDRRGHGGSGDGPGYGLAREAADVASVLAALGGGDVVAHSYGALVALEAARGGAAVRRLALYEPPIVTRPGAYFPRDVMATMRAAVASGDNDGAVSAFARGVMGASAAQIGMMRRMPGWAARCAGAPVLVRELAEVDRFRLDPAAFAGWTVPTLILRGADSSADYQDTAEALRAALPGSRLALLEGQRHGAIEAAPALFADVVKEFLSPSAAPRGPAGGSPPPAPRTPGRRSASASSSRRRTR
jgi:pimeloyl-ACP methyl ester carboxylesterase